MIGIRFRKILGFLVLAYGLFFCHFVHAADTVTKMEDFTFVQLSDTHWGFNDPKINPDASLTLKKAITAVNAMNPQPDFIVFTGDLTHTTSDAKERRKRLMGFRDIVSGLQIKDLKFLPGEHDAALDNGQAYKEVFGETHYVFEHKGIYFIALDNVSDPKSTLGDEQLQWMKMEVAKLPPDARIVVLTHRPLFDLYPQWDWWTKDGAKALEMLKPFKNVQVFYGHIHQLNEHTEGDITFHAAKGLMYPLPAPGSVEKKAPVSWDPASPYNGLGFRSITVKASGEFVIMEYSVEGVMKMAMADVDSPEKVIQITAKKFEYNPNKIVLKKGVPVSLELTTKDVVHGFNCPELGIHAEIRPGKAAAVHITPQKIGTFEFFCDIFCGEGHEDMRGKIVVEP
ncbi:MAG: cupredoxin domain-containing protein [Candidatus Omnitrophica bacterium]|nr:cupredoxin domain-containing protein [Candidatus Omnitrophota bacterium]